MEVKVKKEHIKLGVRGKGVLCPIAIAINVQLKIADNYALCGKRTLMILQRYPFTLAARFFLPKEARRFVHDFESGLKVKPITFEMEDE